MSKISCCNSVDESPLEEIKIPQKRTDKLLTVTPQALEKIRDLLKGEEGVNGVRVGVRRGGCTGLSYTFEYVKDAADTDEIIEIEDVKIFINKTALLYIIGTTMDFYDEKIRSGFTFTNPNAKASCGCGSSFAV